MKNNPLFTCGKTESGKPIVCGVFQLTDTHGYPLSFALDNADKYGVTISFPHFFASAIEHGWDDCRIFKTIRDALADRGGIEHYEIIRAACIEMFMNVAAGMTGKPATEIGKVMRENIESQK